MKDDMHIVLYCPGMPFHGGSLAEGASLGGSETAACELARELAALGHQVTLFTAIPREQEGTWDGVRYLSMGQPGPAAPLGDAFEWYASSTPHDLLIVQRVPDGFHRPFAAKVNFWWSHDLALKRHMPALARQLWNVDRVLAVSAFHRGQIASVYGIPEPRIEVVPNAIDPHRFAAAGERIASGADWAEGKWSGGRMIYSSRPERGLAFLVAPGGVMERLAEAAPELKLVVAGYDNTTPAMRPLYESLWNRCVALPNVELAGSLSKQVLAECMNGAFLHVYPTLFEEVSCITAMEAQAAGNPVIATRLAALPETLEGGAALWLEPDAGTLVEQTAEQILRLRADRPRWEALHAQALEKARGYRWRASAERVTALAEEVLRERSRSPRRLARHLIRQSDIMACRALAARGTGGEPGVDIAVCNELRTKYGFVEDGSYREHYEALARWERERGLDHGHDAPERLLAMPRFRVVEEIAAALPAGARVLDYGCGQGHFTAALARRFPALRFTGIDLAPANIEQGRARLADAGLDNVSLVAGDAASVTETYDLILACEVLEHVPDPGALADALEARLVPGGTLCVTVPYGPWEAESYARAPYRMHLYHFERQDLLELWGHKPDYRVLAIPVRLNELGDALGCYRITWRAGGAPSGAVDLERKLRSQAPRETLSAILVCRDGGQTLARTLESVRGIADQIVIGFDGDPAEPGPGWEIARRYGAEAFSIPSPLTIGFDAARNLTLKRAWGDWVLWIDDDEVFEWPERIAKYLRPNVYEAYAVKQHHYSVEPEGVIKTDFPCRLFRRREGVRFYGLVHEHPERGLNRGFGQVLLLPDVAICHAGYDTEDVRRRRFQRNLPLMLRDRELYPERLLGKFLWIRDLAHLNRYDWERHGAIGAAMRERAGEAIRLWRELLRSGQARIAMDALPYYSEAVQVLSGEGIAFEVAMGASRGGLGDLQPAGAPPPLRGRFLDTGDIRALTEAMMHEKTRLFDERYC